MKARTVAAIISIAGPAVAQISVFFVDSRKIGSAKSPEIREPDELGHKAPSRGVIVWNELYTVGEYGIEDEQTVIGS